MIDHNAEMPERHVASTVALGRATGNEAAYGVDVSVLAAPDGFPVVVPLRAGGMRNTHEVPR